MVFLSKTKTKTSLASIVVTLCVGCNAETASDTQKAETATAAVPEVADGPPRDKENNASGNDTRPIAAKSDEESIDQAASFATGKKPVAEPVPSWKPEDEPLRLPATPEEAAKVLDLRDFPALGEAEYRSGRRLAQFHASVKATSQAAFDFYRSQFQEREFRELDGSRLDGDFGSATYFRDGFLVTLSIYPASGEDQAGKVNVSIQNHGNVNTYQLPVPEGGQAFYGTPIGAAYLTEASVDATVADIRKKLSALGWQPYGTVVGSVYFKQNAVQLMVRVTAAPAQGGQTVLSYSTEFLSVEIPAPAEATIVQYSDSTKRLFVETTGTMEEVATFYRDALAKIGWQATTENPVKIGWKQVLIFRNAAKDMLEVEMFEFEEKIRADVSHKSAAEIAELERLVKEETDKRKAAAESKTAEKLAIVIPDDAQDVKVSDDNDEITFTIGTGKARGAVEAVRKQLIDTGWQEMQATLEAMFGNVTLDKGVQSISLTYIETGVIPAEVTISSFGDLELEQAK